MIDIKDITALVRQINSIKKKIKKLNEKSRKINQFDYEGQEAVAKLQNGLWSDLSGIENEAIRTILKD